MEQYARTLIKGATAEKRDSRITRFLASPLADERTTEPRCAAPFLAFALLYFTLADSGTPAPL